MFAFFTMPCLSQEATEDVVTYRIITKDGNQYVGTIISSANGIIEFQSNSIGKITISETDIESISETSPNSKQWKEHFQSAFYFMGQSGYGLKKGEGSYKNVWILFNSFNYGITDRFSVGIGTIPLFLFGGDVFPFWISPKLSIPIIENKINIAAGALILSAEGESTGLGYSLITLGSRDSNVSIGLARSFEADISELLGILSANFRVSKKTYLITENYLSSGESFSFFGARTMIGRGSIEYGIARPSGIDFIGVPILGMTLPLHKRG